MWHSMAAWREEEGWAVRLYSVAQSSSSFPSASSSQWPTYLCAPHLPESYFLLLCILITALIQSSLHLFSLPFAFLTSMVLTQHSLQVHPLLFPFFEEVLNLKCLHLSFFSVMPDSNSIPLFTMASHFTVFWNSPCFRSHHTSRLITFLSVSFFCSSLSHSNLGNSCITGRVGVIILFTA